MKQEEKTVPAPEAIRQLIINSNTLLQNYQQELTARVQIANREMMQLLGLNPDDGWQLDTKTMTYIKGDIVNQDDSSIS
jgi:hypothetical protein